MEVITINSLNDGINVKSDPTALSEGSVVDCVGFELSKEGTLETAQGLAANDIADKLPSGSVQCFQKCYIGSTLYVMATTSSGLYANGTLVSSIFTGRFKAVSFINNIFLTNGTYSKRFDGTTCYQWGITAPTTSPTITSGAYLTKDIETFETLATWIANQVSCVVSADAAIYKEGTQSANFAVAASTRGYSYRPIVVDGALFSSGAASTTKDYFRCWVYVDNLLNLEELSVFLDVGDGTFVNDYFSYTIVSPGANQGIQALGVGKTSDVISEETTQVPAGTVLTRQVFTPAGSGVGSWGDTWTTEQYVTENATTIINRTTTKTLVDPIIGDQILSFWRRSSLFQLKSATWQEVKIPKERFVQTGDNSKDWSDIVSVKIEVATTSLGTVNVKMDGMKIVGGSDLVGDYWFMYTWGRQDSSDNLLHESGPSRNTTTKQFNIVGPVNFDRHPLTYASRPLSSDPQVTCGIFYGIGGSLGDFWELFTVNDNTTATDTIYNIGDSFVKRLLTSTYTEPAPLGTDLILRRNKIWLIGDPSYPRLLRSSDILLDGTIAPEAWPTRNAYELEENPGALLNLNIINKQLVVKGEFGEWLIKINDPVDYLQVTADRISDRGLLGQDAVIAFETSNVYPSSGGFVESNGASASYILPEIQPLIDDNMINAIGVNAGLVTYFSYNNASLGPRTAKMDLFRGKPRFSNLNNLQLEWLFHDQKAKTTYCVESGNVYILDSGYTNAASLGLELYAYIKSKVYQPSGFVSWNRIQFDHNTGGNWFRLLVYIDDVLVVTHPFISTTRTKGNFQIGPFSGYGLQFVITGNYRTIAKIHFPIRIQHG